MSLIYNMQYTYIRYYNTYFQIQYYKLYYIVKFKTHEKCIPTHIEIVVAQVYKLFNWTLNNVLCTIVPHTYITKKKVENFYDKMQHFQICIYILYKSVLCQVYIVIVKPVLHYFLYCRKKYCYQTVIWFFMFILRWFYLKDC